MFQIKIDLAKKQEGYKEALEAYIKRHSVRGMLVEFGIPDLTPYKDAKRRGWRLRQVNPANVCAVLKSPVYSESDNTYTFDVYPYGGRRDALDCFVKEIMVCTRMMKDDQGKVIEIMQFDFILADNHVDTEHEETGKGKRKK